MPIDGPGAITGDEPVGPVVAVLVALGLERASLVRAGAVGAGIVVAQSGPGPDAAARTATAALAAGAAGLISFGLAGGLASTVQAGTVVLPRRVVTGDGASLAIHVAWRDEIEAVLGGKFQVTDGDLLSVPEPLTTPAAKAHGGACGAVAVDMESGAIATAAARAGAPCAVVRVVVDESSDALPASAAGFVDRHGQPRLGAALGAALRPAEWASFLLLARRYRTARRTLDRVSDSLVSRRFGTAAVFVSAVSAR